MYVTGEYGAVSRGMLRNDSLLQEQIGSVRERQVVRDWLEVRVEFFLLHGNGFEQESLAMHIYIQFLDFPIGGRHLDTFHDELTTLLKMSQ
jgi:hypothetical protein